MNNGQHRAALYARFSTTMQREESITAQVRAMRKYCDDRGWEIVKIYKDMGISGTTDKRPAFQEMISDSDIKLFDVLVVHKLDRFCRNRYDAAIYKSRLQKNGVKLFSVSENIDDSPESILLESLLEGIAEYYSANLAKESMKGMKENAYQCKHTGGMTPLGYDLDKDKKLVINPEEAKIVVLIYTMFLEGYPCRYIADFLNDKGFLTKAGKPFVKDSFDAILRNEKYTGVYVFNKTASKGLDKKRNSHKLKSDEEIIRVEGGCPMIITKEVFEAVQNKIKECKHRGGSFSSKHNYLCSGKIKCGCCGKTMIGMVRYYKETKINYYCNNKRSECSNIKEISRDSIDSFVVELLGKKIFSTADNDSIKSDAEKIKALFQTDLAFRTIIQKYLHQVTVSRERVVFEVFLENGRIGKYSYKRSRFQEKLPIK